MIVVFVLLFTVLNANGQHRTPSFVKGADIGWLSEMEAKGIRFQHANGKQDDCIRILKDLGMNTIRLRVWVNPIEGWCGKEDVLKQARRVKDMGLGLMIDFHYSDWWADPGKQFKPKAWENLDSTSLLNALELHTVEVLSLLKANGVVPEWVQVGNETNDGMLWEDGRASLHMAAFAAMVDRGYEAVKKVNPDSRVIVHISNGYDNKLFRWIFDGLTQHRARFDVIGMSLYPEPAKWKETNEQVLVNMNDMVNRYGKPVMMCEIGLPWDQATAARDAIADLIGKMKTIKDGQGLGVLYWEPQCHNNWKGYKMGAFDNSGRPTEALDAFR
jgi:arabinogalactan endo-1,4-beta-galactosidase